MSPTCADSMPRVHISVDASVDRRRWYVDPLVRVRGDVNDPDTHAPDGSPAESNVGMDDAGTVNESIRTPRPSSNRTVRSPVPEFFAIRTAAPVTPRLPPLTVIRSRTMLSVPAITSSVLS